MLYFPALPVGATGQFPLRKRRLSRTIVNRCADGREVRFADAGAAVLQWDLEFAALSDAEISTLREFFAATEGQLGNFTFLDPTGNLLAWSQNPSHAVWAVDPLLQLTGNMADPLGGNNATRVTNPAGAELSVTQTLNAPGNYTYCLSLYARSATGGSIRLKRQADSAAYPVQANWRRVAFTGQSSGASSTLAAGFGVAAGQTVDVFGVQLEAQAAASTYKPTFAGSGVYASARFGHDTLDITTGAPNRNSCWLRILSTPNA